MTDHTISALTAGDGALADTGRTVILVPRRTGFPQRDQLWAWTRDWWALKLSRMPIIEGHHEVGLFNRSAAVNLAARLAGDWDAAVIIDADVLADPARVLEGVRLAHETGRMVLPFTVRKDLTQAGSQRVMDGYAGSWEPFVKHRYTDGCSSVVIVSRKLWDRVGGFDEAFQGWGWEDNAFAAACETFSGQPLLKMPGEVWHIWHPTAKEGVKGSWSWAANMARAERYRTRIGDEAALRELQEEGRQVAPMTLPGVPKIIHRVVPEVTSEESDRWWAGWQRLHPDWRFLEHRDPLDPADWPLTSGFWRYCHAGAQLADLVRLEALLRWGGVYVDSDMEALRPLDPLMPLRAFAAWEDRGRVPNAVVGAQPEHPAVRAALDLALKRIVGPKSRDIPWATGPGVITEAFRDRPDVLLLPPGSFYPYHYREKDRESADHFHEQPWAFGVHHWRKSWG